MTGYRLRELNPKVSAPTPRGATLIEALLAFAVTAAGLLALVRAHLQFDYAADVARQRGEAVRLAESDLEALRSFDLVGSPGSATDFDTITSTVTGDVEIAHANTSFRLQRQVIPAADGRHRVVSLQVEWSDRQNQAQRVTLRDLITRAAPALSGALALQAPPGTYAAVGGRHKSIPQRAADLGDGRSVFKPVESGTIAWVFDNQSGEITSSCTVPADRPSGRLAAADLAGTCTSVRGQLLAGTVRFNLRGATHRLADGRWVLKPVHPGGLAWILDDGPPARIISLCSVPPGTPAGALSAADLSACTRLDHPVAPFDAAGAAPPLTATDSEAPRWPALALHVRLDLDSSGHPAPATCLADSPASARAGAGAWQVDYACLIPVNADGRWSGRTTIEPLPYADAGIASWPIAAGADAYRVCRYAPSDATDLPDDAHPADYGRHAGTCSDGRAGCSGVTGNLSHQNFLVIAGTQACPTDHAADPAVGDFVNSNTVAHQP
jgi:Tfp pilus assembly protein PilV